MRYETEEFYFESSNKKSDIYAKILYPNKSKEIKGVIQFCHGMCEYFDKYLDFYEFMIENGYIVCGHDCIGHGLSIKNESDKGFFAEKDGYKFLIEDTKKMTNIISRKFKNKPVFLLGHSMGSLVARCYSSKYGEKLSGIVLLGTVGPQPLIESAIKFSDVVISRKGERYRSRMLNQIFMDFANIGFQPVKNKYDWTTSDSERAKFNNDDPKQQFIFTASAFKDVFELVKFANADEFIKTVPKNLPMCFMAGSKDPVGENSVGVKRATKLYKNEKLIDASCKIYPECRHELLNEHDRQKVYKDILEWVEAVRFGEE